MIRRFPYEAALLARTKLRYVDLPSILSDGKVDRSARMPAFVAIYLGAETGLIFLEEGEAVAAGVVTRTQRHAAAVFEVTERGQVDAERAEVGYYRVGAGQLRAMWASIAAPPLLEAEPSSLTSGRRLLSWARWDGFDGVLEILAGDAVHYVVFCAGEVAESYMAGRTKGAPRPEDLERLLTSRPGGQELSARGFARVDRIPPQASPALFALYEKTGAAAFRNLSGMIGTAAAAQVLESARRRVLERHGVLEHFGLSGGRLRARPCPVAAEELTAAVAAWLFEAISSAARGAGDEPIEVMRRVTADHRYALKAQGFYARLPWPLPY